MSTGDPFERRIDFDESMERVKQEGEHGLFDRLVERVKSAFR